ncbi:FAD-binding oxidoreductase [Halosolutus gelatinilyticus]|uniref:FAD-binding oxidoreductase n=1 Tax=Halosolutus gelatinilyticus TaxID=2931975 RepID=UPI001FF16269|nr:FAD-binding oxidoreductase [Halosolutus gelatinilyticus]
MSSDPSIREEAVVSELRTAVDGDVIARADPNYTAARRLWNGRIDRRPAVFVRAASSEDVAAGIAMAREYDLPLSVRGGGHHVTGSALVEDGLVIDLGAMNEVVIDPETRTARVGPGSRVSDVLDPAQEHGLAPIVGSAAQNGVAGSTLAGGIGWLRRKFGLGIDALRSVELVTADGAVLTASESENAELFWAVRGGGSTVGAITGFELELVEVGPDVAVAQTVYPIEAARDVLDAYREYAANAPDEVTTLVAVTRVPPLPEVPPEAVGAPVVMVYGVYAGRVEAGRTAMAPLRELGESLMDASGAQPLAEVHEVARLLFPDDRRYSWHSLYADELSNDVIETLIESLATSPSDESDLSIYHMGGSIADVEPDASAFGFRDADYLLCVSAAWEDAEADTENVAWARRAWDALRERSATVDGFYPGFPGFVEGEERARMAYGDNYDRLAAIAAEYDPDGCFGLSPTAEPSSE